MTHLKAPAACLAGLLILAVVPLVKAQKEDTNTRSLQGTVTDASGRPVANAAVQLKDTKTLQVRSYITGADGTYHFAGLSTETEYQVKADFDGATSGWKSLSVFNTKKVATVNLKLSK